MVLAEKNTVKVMIENSRMVPITRLAFFGNLVLPMYSKAVSQPIAISKQNPILEKKLMTDINNIYATYAISINKNTTSRKRPMGR
jgi:hypothetical protein